MIYSLVCAPPRWYIPSMRLLFWTAVILLTWLACIFLEWGLHALAHKRSKSRLLRAIYDVHMRHHIEAYPPSNIIGERPYRNAGGEYVFLPILGLVWLSLFAALPLKFATLIFVESAFFLWLSNYLHSQFHIKGSWLERAPLVGGRGGWFAIRRARHFYHHGHLRKNMSLGGLSRLADVTLKSFVDVVPESRDDGHDPRPDDNCP